MLFCPECRADFADGSRYCGECGGPLSLGSAKVHSYSITGSRIYLSQLIALVVALGILAIQFFLKPPSLVQGLLFCIALGCGIIIARFPFTVRHSERWAKFLAGRKKRAGQGGKFSRWVIRPAYGICDQSTQLTHGLSDPFVRAGFRAVLWLILGSVTAFIVIYIALVIAAIVAALLLIYFILRFIGDTRPLTERVNLRSGHPEFAKPRERFRIAAKDGKPHIFKVGGLFIQDAGELRRRNFETQETANLFGPNVRITENTTILGSQDPNCPYRVETDDGELMGYLVKDAFGDDYRFEPPEENS